MTLAVSATEGQTIIADMLDWFDRRGNVEQIKRALVARYAVGVREASGVSTEESVSDAPADYIGPEDYGYESYVRSQEAAAIALGLYETPSMGIGPLIAQPLASLFNQPQQHWSFLIGDEPSEDIETLIADHRERGGFWQAITSADYTACAIESGAVWVRYDSGGMVYNAVSPACVHALFGDVVKDRDGNERPPRTSDIEDALMVVISTGYDSDDKPRWTAYLGESEYYPQGRYCSYTADRWDDLPELGEERIIAEYLVGGEPANPMVLADDDGPQYPIVILRGGVMRNSTDLLPITTDLYEASKELDVAWARCLKSGLDEMSGTLAVKTEFGRSLPRRKNGLMALSMGQDVQMLSANAGNAQSMAEVIDGLCKQLAASYGVPGYMVSRRTATVESGIALAIQSQALVQTRRLRIKLNHGQVMRLFDIERALINVHDDANIPGEVRCAWNPGDYDFPRDPKALAEEIEKTKGLGLISHVEGIMRYHALPSVDAAIKKYESMIEQDRQYQAPRNPQRVTSFGR
jgi:hypothetical protein